MHQRADTCHRTYTHADRLPRYAWFRFHLLRSTTSRARVISSDLKGANQWLYTIYFYSIILEYVGNYFRLHKSGGTFHTIFIDINVFVKVHYIR